MYLRKIIFSFLISIFLANAAFATSWQGTFPFNQSAFLRENTNCALARNAYPQTFAKNLNDFENFLYMNNLRGTSPEIQAISKFIPPILDEKKDALLQHEKITKNITASLYFNALKDDKIADLQKQKITVYKELFDISKETYVFKEIAQTTSDYMDAQVKLLEYQQAKKLCFKNLASFAGKEFEIPATDDLNQFEIKDPVEKMLLQNFKGNAEKEGLVYKLRCDYGRYVALNEKIKKMENPAVKETHLIELQDRLDIIEMKKRQTNLKLACLIDYLSILD
jgi:hypothetical protein